MHDAQSPSWFHGLHMKAGLHAEPLKKTGVFWWVTLLLLPESALTVALASCWSYTTNGREKEVPTAAVDVSTPHSLMLLPAKRCPVVAEVAEASILHWLQETWASHGRWRRFTL